MTFDSTIYTSKKYLLYNKTFDAWYDVDSYLKIITNIKKKFLIKNEFSDLNLLFKFLVI